MDSKITLEGTSPVLSVRLLRGEEKFLSLSISYSTHHGRKNFIYELSRVEALTFWNFLDEALEIPLNYPKK